MYNLKATDSNYERNAFRKIREQHKNEKSSFDSHDANTLKTNMTTYVENQSHDVNHLD